MNELINVTNLIIVATVIPSLMAFSNHNLVDEFLFWPYRMWRTKEWYRLITSGFLHNDMAHLFFNMFALYSFGMYVEDAFVSIMGSMGHAIYACMYLLAIVVADLYSLVKRKDDYGYRALGASGGVSAIVFASILLHPLGQIGMIFLPPELGIPAVLFGVLYLFYCSYMAKRGQDNIDHTAHFWGSVFGFIFPLFFAPGLILEFISQIMGRV